MVYWVMARLKAQQQPAALSRAASLVARFGPVIREAERVRAKTVLQYRNPGKLAIEAACDYVRARYHDQGGKVSPLHPHAIVEFDLAVVSS
jgi:hypothetical protein